MQHAERDQARHLSGPTGALFAVCNGWFLFEVAVSEQRPAVPLREDREGWAGDMQSKRRTAQRSPITHGSRFTQRLHNIMRRKKKIIGLVGSKVRARRLPSKVRSRKVIKSCESEIFWLMSRVHERQKMAECKSTQNYRWRSWELDDG